MTHHIFPSPVMLDENSIERFGICNTETNE